MDGAGKAIETPSGKWSGDENFPVGSWLLSARLRPHVAAFYALARTLVPAAQGRARTGEYVCPAGGTACRVRVTRIVPTVLRRGASGPCVRAAQSMASHASMETVPTSAGIAVSAFVRTTAARAWTIAIVPADRVCWPRFVRWLTTRVSVPSIITPSPTVAASRAGARRSTTLRPKVRRYRSTVPVATTAP